MKSRIVMVAVGTVLSLFTPGVGSSRAVAAPRAQDVLAALPFSAAEKQHIVGGDVVTTSAKESSERELAVAMAFLVQQPPADLVGEFRAAGGLKTDRIISGYGEITGDGSLDDFKGLTLLPDREQATQRYLDAKPGEEWNLDTAEIAAFAALKAQHVAGTDAVQPVEAEVRDMLLARYRAYRAGGLSAIAPYDRGGSKRQPGEELMHASAASAAVVQCAPALQEVLLMYPQAKPAQIEERFFWINFTIDAQPTIALSHRLAQQLDGGGYLVADRHYYVSRSHNTVQVVGGLLPVSEGTIVFWINRTSTDQAGGFASWLKRAIGDRIMAKQMSDTFVKLLAHHL